MTEYDKGIEPEKCNQSTVAYQRVSILIISCSLFKRNAMLLRIVVDFISTLLC